MFLLRFRFLDTSLHGTQVHESVPNEQPSSNFVAAEQCVDVRSLSHGQAVLHCCFILSLILFSMHSSVQCPSLVISTSYFRFAIAVAGWHL